MSEYARGGLVPGTMTMRATFEGVCTCGRPAYRFGDNEPEHVITALECAASDMSACHVPEMVDSQPVSTPKSVEQPEQVGREGSEAQRGGEGREG